MVIEMDKEKLTIYWPDTSCMDIEEVKFCRFFCKEKSMSMSAGESLDLYWIDYDPGISIEKLLSQNNASLILVVTDPEILLSYTAIMSMVRCVKKIGYATGPVYNLTDYSNQQADILTPYLNITSLQEIISEFYTKETFCHEVKMLDPSCIIYPLDYFDRLPSSKIQCSFLDFAKMDFPKNVDRAALVHRFGDYYEGERADLIELIPQDVKEVLDVGCAQGGYGRRLKSVRADISIIGVEMNHTMAVKAQQYYDHVFVGKLEDISFERNIDLINCGDVVEHLYNPWGMLNKLHTLLKIRGNLVLSVPNIGHWSIVRDLLKGRFEYVPVGLLCISHIRWFTEQSIKKALKDAGFEIDIFKRQQLPPTKSGKEFVRSMVREKWADENSLLTNEFIIRAKKI